MVAFKFELVSPERLLVSEEASQVVVPGAEGDFTVFAGHSQLLSTLRPGVLGISLADGKSRRVFVRGGFAEVDASGLTILAQQAVDVGEAGKDWVARELETAQQTLATATGDEERRYAYAAVEALRSLV